MSRGRFWFYAALARQILTAMERGEERIDISVDLNLSRRTFGLDGESLILDAETRLGLEALNRIAAKENRVFLLEDGQLEILEIREEGYCKLVPTDKAPLLEISGVKMHISKDVDPFDSASQMAAQVVRKGHRVLDTCSGLGYAASAAAQLGAREVLSVERSETVMALREKNPWSQGLFGGKIQRVHADVHDYIRELPAESFDSVIHDPPRFSLAGELYGEAFYRDLFRVLRKRGVVFHYTGNPHLVKRGSRFVDQVARRLKLAGFRKVQMVPDLMGVTAWK